MVTNIYREEILEHWQNPLNWGTMENADLVVDQINPFCGDKLEFYFKLVHLRGGNGQSKAHLGGVLRDVEIRDVSFTGSGCAVSIASASILSENIKNKSIEAVSKISGDDVLEMIGGDITPARLKCAFLALEAVKKIATDH